MKRIIVTLDQSPVSESALPLARGLVAMTGTPVSLVTVLEVPASLPDDITGSEIESTDEPWDDPRAMRGSMPIEPGSPGSPGAEVDPADVDETAERYKQAEQYLERIAATFPNVPVQRHVLYGDAVEEIVQALEPAGRHRVIDPDDQPMAVMASHGRSGLGRVLVGSVAWRVVQRASAPVFLVRGREDAGASEGEQRLRKAVVAVDGSFFSEKVLLAVRQYLGDAAVEVHLIRVVDQNDESGRDEAERYLRSVSEWMSSQGYSVTSELAEGEVDARINDAAVSSGADLIALATHGRMGVNRLRLGSVAESVVRSASQPLMLIRPPEGE